MNKKVLIAYFFHEGEAYATSHSVKQLTYKNGGK